MTEQNLVTKKGAKNYDHMVWNTRTDSFECKHCEDGYRVNMPIPINMLLALYKAFRKDHKNCKKQKEN